MRRAILLVVVGALAAAGHASAAPAPLRVTSISPPVAERGELVSIAGGGFGARNLEVTVGGVPVELVSATGSRASFRVPALGAVGDVTVEARNPGGHVGRIGLTVRFDGQTAAVADETAAVEVAVGADGGTIAVEGMTLAIPAGAVPEGTEISATPLRSLQGSPFAAAPVGLKLEPSGLVLLEPATLTLPRPVGPGQLVGFGFNGDGDGFHLVPASGSGESVELKVWHFSGAGVLNARLDELEAALSYEPAPAHERAEQQIGAALVDAQVNGSNPGPAIFVALRNWRTSSVSQGLQIAGSTTRIDFFELAFGEWLAWLAYLQEYRDTLAPAESSFFDTASALDRNTATASAAAVARRQLERCLGPDLPRAALRDVIRIASAVNLADLPIEGGEPGERPLPTGPNLPGACVDVQITAVEHAAAFARDRSNLVRVRAQVVFWSGDPSTTIPLRYRLAGVATETTSNGRFTFTRRPSELGTDELQLTVDLDTTGTDTVLRTIFEQRHLSIPVRERLELHARRSGDSTFTDTPGTVAPGSTVALRIRLAGDNIDAIPITLTHDGTGTLPATATTGTNGEATATYTAPAGAQIELVTATLTENGITGGDALVITTREPVVVTVNPSFGFANSGGSVQFSAIVTGTSDHRVSWNVSGAGGTISSTGRFTAGSTAGTFTVTAVSLAEPSSVGTAFVQVTSEDVTGLYLEQSCAATPANCASRVSYQCLFRSVAAGTVCGWFVGNDSSDRPNFAAARCQIDTDGTRAGGAFTARITSCAFGMTSAQADAQITGSIGNGTLSFSASADIDRDGSRELVESYTFTKWVP